MVASVGMTRSRNNWAFGGTLAAITLASLVLLVWVGPAITDEWWQDVVKDLAIAVLLAVAITGLWRLRGNRMFAQEVLELQNVGESVERWGVRELSMDWEKIDWKSLFQHAKEVSIIHGYAYTWSSGGRQALLEEFAAQRGRKLRIALPDPGNEVIMEALAKRFNTTKDVVQDRVREATDRYLALRRPKGADVRVYYRDGEPVYAGYLFDSELVVTLYTHRRAKVSTVPVIQCRGGELVDFVKADLTEVFKISSEVPTTGASTA